MVVAEARRTFTYLSLFGYHVDAVIANRMLPDAIDDPWFARWKATQSAHLDTIEDAFGPLPGARRRARRTTSSSGLDAARRRSAPTLYGDVDPAAALADDRAAARRCRRHDARAVGAPARSPNATTCGSAAARRSCSSRSGRTAARSSSPDSLAAARGHRRPARRRPPRGRVRMTGEPDRDDTATPRRRTRSAHFWKRRARVAGRGARRDRRRRRDSSTSRCRPKPRAAHAASPPHRCRRSADRVDHRTRHRRHQGARCRRSTTPATSCAKLRRPSPRARSSPRSSRCAPRSSTSSTSPGAAVGVGAAGLVDRDGHGSPTRRTSPACATRRCATSCAARLDRPVVVDNDANVAALGEVTVRRRRRRSRTR